MAQGFNWIPWTSHQGLPPMALHVGNDQDGAPLFVGRAHHEGDLIPGKAIPTKQACYVCWGEREIFKTTFEILTGSGFSWVPCSNGKVPHGAILGGHTTTGEKLYIGRAHHDGSLTPGKIHGSHGCLYIPFGGDEHSYKHYEVLVAQ